MGFFESIQYWFANFDILYSTTNFANWFEMNIMDGVLPFLFDNVFFHLLNFMNTIMGWW